MSAFFLFFDRILKESAVKELSTYQKLAELDVNKDNVNAKQVTIGAGALKSAKCSEKEDLSLRCGTIIFVTEIIKKL